MGKLTKEVILIGGGHAGVRIGATDNAKLKGVGTQVSLVAETFAEGRAGIFVLQHFRFFVRA